MTVIEYGVMRCGCVFFFKQKTAYEIQYGLVGSEMCIRDSGGEEFHGFPVQGVEAVEQFFAEDRVALAVAAFAPVSYTHLTLPTSDLVQISVVAVSLKKKIIDIAGGAAD